MPRLDGRPGFQLKVRSQIILLFSFTFQFFLPIDFPSSLQCPLLHLGALCFFFSSVWTCISVHRQRASHSLERGMLINANSLVSHGEDRGIPDSAYQSLVLFRFGTLARAVAQIVQCFSRRFLLLVARTQLLNQGGVPLMDELVHGQAE